MNDITFVCQEFEQMDASTDVGTGNQDNQFGCELQDYWHYWYNVLKKCVKIILDADDNK